MIDLTQDTLTAEWAALTRKSSREHPTTDDRGGGKLTREFTLAAETKRLRAWFGLPIRMLPVARGSDADLLRRYTLGLNHLISGETADPWLWRFLEPFLPARAAASLKQTTLLTFNSLWTPEEAAELCRQDAETVQREWLLRVHRHRASAAASKTIRQDGDFAANWHDLSVGDFDFDGRGRDYTRGMKFFQAARAYGIESLLNLFGDLKSDTGGYYLDVLGGDGYILRIHEAGRQLSRKHVVVARASAGTGEALADRAALERLAASIPAAGDAPPWVLLLLLAPGGERAGVSSRILAFSGGKLEAGAAFEISGGELVRLASSPSVAVLDSQDSLEKTLRRAFRLVCRRRGQEPQIVTNDISAHMFFSGGQWGLATREDARYLSRTFHRESLDGVIFAYGTHHIDCFSEAFRECYKILRAGGRILVHDFLDEGQVGTWFHQVVHKNSRTGHDFSHLGLIRLAALLLIAGFRDLQLYEMEDPFVFSRAEGSRRDARQVAWTYLLGMYGMNEAFEGEPERFEQVVRRVLSYPEIGNVAWLSEDLVYIPRRATVVTAVRPFDSGAQQTSASDRALIEILDGLLSAGVEELVATMEIDQELRRHWFGQDGSRWGLTREEQRLWTAWRKELAGRAPEAQ